MEIDLDTLVQRLRSWEAHLMHGDTHRLRRKLFDYWVFVRDAEARERMLARRLREEIEEELFRLRAKCNSARRVKSY